MTSMLVCALLAAGAHGDRGAPLTSAQLSKLQQVVRQTQDRNETLKSALDKSQVKLMQAYAEFELDDARITQLHTEIIDLQRKILLSYRDLQVELRKIVGQQRFTHLKKRIDLILDGGKKVQVGQPPSGEAADRSPASAAETRPHS